MRASGLWFVKKMEKSSRSGWNYIVKCSRCHDTKATCGAMWLRGRKLTNVSGPFSPAWISRTVASADQVIYSTKPEKSNKALFTLWRHLIIFTTTPHLFKREQGWSSGESTRLPPMWLRIDSQTRHNMWVEFVVDSLLCSERLSSGYSGYPLSSKTNISKF